MREPKEGIVEFNNARSLEASKRKCFGTLYHNDLQVSHFPHYFGRHIHFNCRYDTHKYKLDAEVGCQCRHDPDSDLFLKIGEERAGQKTGDIPLSFYSME